MTRTVLYEADIGDHARKRHFHVVLRGHVVKFTVQLEVWHDDAWQPIVRYDGSHGFSHVDVFRRDGRKRKVRLYMSFDEALTAADNDIRERSWIYLERFLRGDWP